MMDNNTPKDPWDRDYYQTGSTKPPKSHGGLIAVLLALVILLSGIVSALSLLNIRISFGNSQGTEPPMSFFESTPADQTDSSASVDGPTAPLSGGDVKVELNEIPEKVENVPQAGGLSLQAIYSKNIPSVVSISCQLSSGSSSGTGVILSQDGYIVTNSHVIDGAVSIQVLLTDQRTFPATVVGQDDISDLAVLYISAKDLVPAEFGNSAGVRVGDAVVAIGDPLGVSLRGTMTDGIISAINRDVTTGNKTMTLLQTNAALNSGNSGGPLINCFGQVIGINTLKIGAFVDSAGVEGLGFAIPSTTVKDIVEELLTNGFVSGRPKIGIAGQNLPLYYRQRYKIPNGLLITQVEQGSAAEKAGIQVGDILLQLDGVHITEAEDVESVLYAHEIGDTLNAVLYRYKNTTRYEVTITLGEVSATSH